MTVRAVCDGWYLAEDRRRWRARCAGWAWGNDTVDERAKHPRRPPKPSIRCQRSGRWPFARRRPASTRNVFAQNFFSFGNSSELSYFVWFTFFVGFTRHSYARVDDDGAPFGCDFYAPMLYIVRIIGQNDVVTIWLWCHATNAYKSVVRLAVIAVYRYAQLQNTKSGELNWWLHALSALQTASIFAVSLLHILSTVPRCLYFFSPCI